MTITDSHQIWRKFGHGNMLQGAKRILSNCKFVDAVNLFLKTVENLKKGEINLHSPLEEIVIRKCKNDLAYIDNRRDAMDRYGFDFWNGLDVKQLRAQGIGKEMMYSSSGQFPDFLFKLGKYKGKIIGGSLIEMKDTKSGSIASFNSTIPTKCKTLGEINAINGGELVSKIAKVKDSNLAINNNALEFERRCFYLVRTHKEKKGKVKVSIVDGSFFETLPKDHLIYQVFLGILQSHLRQKEVKISEEILEEVKKILSYVTDQTIIASSRSIEKASVKPRLRIMAEVHPEGNPHSSSNYPWIKGTSFNLILQSSSQVERLKEWISTNLPEIYIFPIYHKRNGEHIVFQLIPRGIK